MARPFERLRGLNIAALIEEAVKTLNPEQGLTHEEMVNFVCSRLGFEEENIQSRVNEILLAGTQSGAIIKTDCDGYILNDKVQRRRLTLDAGKKRRAVRRKRSKQSSRRRKRINKKR